MTREEFRLLAVTSGPSGLTDQLPVDASVYSFHRGERVYCAEFVTPLRLAVPAGVDLSRFAPEYLEEDEQGPFVWAYFAAVSPDSSTERTVPGGGNEMSAALGIIDDQAAAVDFGLDPASVVWVATVTIGAPVAKAAGTVPPPHAASTVPPINEASTVPPINEASAASPVRASATLTEPGRSHDYREDYRYQGGSGLPSPASPKNAKRKIIGIGIVVAAVLLILALILWLTGGPDETGQPTVTTSPSTTTSVRTTTSELPPPPPPPISTSETPE